MKKIGILTHYTVNNQGAILQLYALYHQLKDMGYEPYVLTYQKNFDFADEDTRKRYHIGPGSYGYFIKEYLIKKGFRITYFNYRKNQILSRFKQEEFRFTDYQDDSMDVAIVGSDEVFSIPVGINQMMYGYGVGADRLVSYAPSFGQTDLALLQQHNCVDLISNGLKKFDSLSVRDQHSAEMVRSLADVDAQIVCDPVVLYDFSKRPIGKRKISQDYILVYAYDKMMNNPEEIEAIRGFAKRRNLKVVSAGTYHKWCDYNIPCDPVEWLDYFHYASYAVVDTFHGLLASLVTGSNVAILVRSINTNKLNYLANQFGVENRIVRGDLTRQLEKVFNTEPDYETINGCINDLRKKGLSFLTRSIEGSVNEQYQ